MTKRYFWRLFSAAWKQAVTEKNIKSAFAAPGLSPLDLKKVLDRLKKKTPSPIQSDTKSKRKTPCSVRGLCCLAKQIYKDQAQLNKDTALLIHISKKLTA